MKVFHCQRRKGGMDGGRGEEVFSPLWEPGFSTLPRPPCWSLEFSCAPGPCLHVKATGGSLGKQRALQEERGSEDVR